MPRLVKGTPRISQSKQSVQCNWHVRMLAGWQSNCRTAAKIAVQPRPTHRAGHMRALCAPEFQAPCCPPAHADTPRQYTAGSICQGQCARHALQHREPKSTQALHILMMVACKRRWRKPNAQTFLGSTDFGIPGLDCDHFHEASVNLPMCCDAQAIGGWAWHAHALVQVQTMIAEGENAE